MTGLSSLSRVLYKASRASGDLNAMQTGGPERLAKRVVKRAVHRKEIGVLRRWRLW